MGAVASIAQATKLPALSLVSLWVGVVTTASAAVTAHLQASRYDHQAMTYFGTAERLKDLRNQWLADKRLEPRRVADVVNECEHAISTENEAWLAEWTREQT